MSREAFISWVERHNGINGNMIKAGEKIVIPVEKNEIRDDKRELAMKSQWETKK
ncbi:Peptidoglycan-binding LysM [Heyndrickxia coagulans 2-6]|nr:Peptidoglycan-binding LysM [Heyndrickxia coagulans 2-6]